MATSGHDARPSMAESSITASEPGLLPVRRRSIEQVPLMTLRLRKILPRMPPHSDSEGEDERPAGMFQLPDHMKGGVDQYANAGAADDTSSVASEEFNAENGYYRWQVVEKQVPVPFDYLDLQMSIARAFPKHRRLLAIEWEDGTTVPPASADFNEGDVITLREFKINIPTGGLAGPPRMPPKVDLGWDDEYADRLGTVKDTWGDTEKTN